MYERLLNKLKNTKPHYRNEKMNDAGKLAWNMGKLVLGESGKTENCGVFYDLTTEGTMQWVKRKGMQK